MTPFTDCYAEILEHKKGYISIGGFNLLTDEDRLTYQTSNKKFIVDCMNRYGFAQSEFSELIRLYKGE